MFAKRKSFAHGRHGQVAQQSQLMASVLSGVDLAYQNLESVELGVEITRQEAWTQRTDGVQIRVPDLIEEVVERIAFEARDDKRIDKRSGVSQRMPITAMENVVSNAEQRALRNGDSEAVPRVADVYAALPAITGKIELEYEGELVGGATIAKDLIRRACDAESEGPKVGYELHKIRLEDGILFWRARRRNEFQRCR